MFAITRIDTHNETKEVIGGTRSISQIQILEIQCRAKLFDRRTKTVNLTHENTNLHMFTDADNFFGMYSVIRHTYNDLGGIRVVNITAWRRQELPVVSESCKKCKYYFGKMQMHCGVYAYEPDNVENCPDFQK